MDTLRDNEIDWEVMEHECGGTVFEMSEHREGERVFWCMNCDKYMVLEADDE